MTVELLDLTTGERRDCSAFGEFPVEWWTEGNGSCDCNRRIAWGEGQPDGGVCEGCHRWVIVGVGGDLEGQTAAEVLAQCNGEYSKGGK